MTSQDQISCEDNNPIANLNFNRSDYFIHFFTISPIPLVCLFSLYQSISAGAKSIEDIGTWGVGLYFIFSWILYPVSFLAIQFMASRKMNLRKTSEKATSRITYKYFSVLVGYLLAIPLSPIGFTTISHIKQYQALKAQAKAMQEEHDKAQVQAEAKGEAEAKTEDEGEAKTEAEANNEPKGEASREALSEVETENKDKSSLEIEAQVTDTKADRSIPEAKNTEAHSSSESENSPHTTDSVANK